MPIVNGRGRVGIRKAVTPSIITSGLVLYVDAGKASSYPGTGTAWSDLSGNGNNGVLTPGGTGLTFSSANGGFIGFDGINDYASFADSLSLNINQKQQTVSCWFKTSQTNFGTYGTYLVSKIGTVRKWTYSLMMISGGKIEFQRDDSVNNPYIRTTGSYNDGKWHNVAVTNNGTISIYIDGTLVASGADTTTGSTSNANPVWIGSNGNNGGYAGAYFSGAISNAQVYNRALSAAEVLQNFDLMKARFYPQVADADAQSFIYAASIQDSTQASAVNTLVTSLKAAGIWAKMKAVYPMVGGSAASHKWNLKDPRDLDAAYRLAFTAGWVHGSTGAKPNGTSDYADTKFVPSSNFTSSQGHISYYSRTNSFGVKRDVSAYGANIYSYSKFDSSNNAYFRFAGGEVGYLNSDSRGLYTMSRTSSAARFFKNSVYKTAGASAAFSSSVISIGGGTGGTPSDREIAFASIGDYLTDAEVSTLYDTVQAYQTSLGRQV